MDLECPKCSGEMAEGTILDPGIIYDVLNEKKGVLWVQGKIERFALTGYKKSIKGKLQFSVKSYRCADCGFLEFYAK